MKATIRDIARKAGVTTATVSYVLNNKPNSRISAKTQEKVMQAAEALEYSPHLHARSLVTGRSFTITTHVSGSVENVLHDPYSVDVLRGVITKASLHDYAVQVTMEGRTPKHHGVDGWLCIMSTQRLPTLMTQDCPVVYLDPRGELGTDCYWAHNFDAGELMAQKTSLAFSKVLFLAHEKLDEGPLAYQRRYEGFQGVFTARHGPQSVILDHVHPEGPEESFREKFEEWFSRSGKRDIPLLVCASDFLASRMLRAARVARVSVPRDLAIAGFDNTNHSQMSLPPISTIDLGAEQLGMEAARVLIERIEGRKSPLAAPSPRWIARESCPLE